MIEQTRNMRTRAATALAVVGLIVTACSGSATPTPAASTAPSTAPASAAASAAPSPSAAASAAGGSLAGQSVTVIGTWGGSEQDAFMAMVKPWEDQTGATVKYTGTRDLNTVLTTGVASGVLPDLAGLPGPGQMNEWASSLTDLSTVLDVNTYKSETAAPLVDLGTVSGKQVGIFIKAAVKGLIWYSPKAFQQGSYQPPKTWDDLVALSQKIAGKAATPWSIGLESGAATGWPGTDWLEDIVLRQSGADVYDQWWQGKAKWSSDQIKTAWQTWGKIAGDSKMVFGGSATMLTTNFGDAPKPIFGVTPPKALMVHEASFETSFIQAVNKSLQAGH